MQLAKPYRVLSTFGPNQEFVDKLVSLSVRFLVVGSLAITSVATTVQRCNTLRRR